MIDIRDHGAVGDGATLNTGAIQAAIDACSAAGGGTVRIEGGIFLTGTLILKDHVRLELAAGAELLGSPRIEDYATGCGKNMYRGEASMDRCLIFADGARHIGITGHGAIDGNGGCFPNEADADRHRPMLLRLMNCTGVRMRDLTLRAPAAWTSAWLYCNDIVVSGVTIDSRVNANGDGLDFDGCCDVRVSDCAFDTSDDAICLQTSRPDRPCRDVTVTNCTFRSQWAGMRIGLLSRGDFENVAVSNCIFRDIRDAGLKIQMCEGACMQNMAFSNLVMRSVPRPLFMTLGRQRCCVDAPPQPAPAGRMRGMQFNGLLVDNRACGPDSQIVVTGIPGAWIEEVAFHNVRMVSGGGGTREQARTDGVPELTPENLGGHWPEYRCFGRALPAFGMYARHVRHMMCHNLRFDTIEPDARDAVVWTDVTPSP